MVAEPAFKSGTACCATEFNNIKNSVQYQRGVETGIVPSQTGAGDMTITLTAGWFWIDKVRYYYAGGTQAIDAAHATLHRWDIVYFTSAGIQYTAGTAAANPTMPTMPASAIIIAAVYVAATDAAITDDEIRDERVLTAFPTPVTNMWGTGASGAVNIAASATMTADYNATTLNVATGQTLTTAGYRIYATTSVTTTGTGIIRCNATGATAITGVTVPGSTAGGAAGAIATVGANSLSAAYIGGMGGMGGAGGAGTTPCGGGGMCPWSGTTVLLNILKFGNAHAGTERLFTHLFDSSATDATLYYAGAGGGGGGGGSTSGGAGGAGGAGGGMVYIAAPTITNNGSFTANGGNGAAGTGDADGAGGGGGGGGGGVIFLLYNSLAVAGTITANGGTGGAGGTTNGAPGGTTGSIGLIIRMKPNGVIDYLGP